MSRPQVAVVQIPGVNCEYETARPPQEKWLSEGFQLTRQCMESIVGLIATSRPLRRASQY